MIYQFAKEGKFVRSYKDMAELTKRLKLSAMAVQRQLDGRVSEVKGHTFHQDIQKDSRRKHAIWVDL